MLRPVSVLTLASILLLTSSSADATCGAISKVSCINERQFLVCEADGSILDSNYYACPLDNQFCGDVEGGCTTDEALKGTTDTYCNRCSAAGFACTDLGKFVPCTNGVIDEVTPTECTDPNKYCNFFNFNPLDPCEGFNGKQVLCWPNVGGGGGAVSPADCGGVEGNVPIETETAVFDTCNFIYCSIVGGQMTSEKLTCAPGQTFNRNIKRCVVGEAGSCPAPAA